jgi:hypothetical protein
VTAGIAARLRRIDPAWRHGLSAYAAVRLLLAALALLVVLAYPGSLDPQSAYRERLGLPAAGTLAGKALWGVWLRWDTLWYVRYARDGLLPAGDPEYRAFWPLYPWLMRAVAPLLGGSYLAAGILIANLALLLGAVLFYRLAEIEAGAEAARRGMWYMLLFPSAFFFFAAYSESVFLLLSVAAFLAARRGRWAWAGVWVAAAAVTRIPGAFMIPALGFEYLRQRRGDGGWAALQDAGWWRVTVLGGWPFVLMIAGAAFTPAYTALFLGGGKVDTVVEFHVRTAVAGAGIVFPWQALAEAFRALIGGQFYAIQPIDLAATLLFLGLTVLAFRCLPAGYGLYMAVTMAVLLARSIPQQPLISASRYVLTLFPGFIVLGQLGRPGWRNRAIVYPSLLGLGFMAGEFMIGGYVG